MKISDNLSPSSSGLVPGRDEKETRVRTTFVSKLSAPDSQTAFKFGSPAHGLVSNNPLGSKISVADPRTKYKPSGFLSLEKSNDVATSMINSDRKVDHLFWREASSRS